MSIPLLEGPDRSGGFGGDGGETALIAGLLQEFFPHRLPGSEVPSGLPHPPVAVAGIPVNGPKAVVANTGPDLGLTGGFPSTTDSGPPPVHPSVVAAEPDPEPVRSPGGTDPFDKESGDSGAYRFGEPRLLWAGGYPTAEEGNSGKNVPSFSSAESSPPEELPYFLQGLSGVKNVGHPGTEVRHSNAGFDIDGVRRHFPALHQTVNGRPLIWLDNAATTHKPQAVLDATSQFYGRDNSNIHRAAHALAERSTELFENGREKVRQFLGAADKKEIIFVRGTTEGINLIAQTYGKKHIGAGDEILLSQLEHHANIVPWQLLAQQTGASLRVIPINDRGELLLEELPRLITDRTKIVSVTQVSNALGTVNPVEEIIRVAHSRGVPVVVDGAQSTPHLPVNVQAMDADFFVFSGHKVFGPTGIGAVYGKAALLGNLPPWQGGGHMIRDVTFERTTYQNAPERFEAGTPDIAGVVGLAAAIDFMMRVGIPGIAAYEHALLEYATSALESVPGVRPIGTASNKASVFGFVIPGVANDHIARHLDKHGIAVRAGHHCAMPAVRHFGVETTVRPSLAFYNTFAEIDTFIRILKSLPRP